VNKKKVKSIIYILIFIFLFFCFEWIYGFIIVTIGLISKSFDFPFPWLFMYKFDFLIAFVGSILVTPKLFKNYRVQAFINACQDNEIKKTQIPDTRDDDSI
jgi:hypothetical protein